MRLSSGDPFPHLTGHTPTGVMRMDYMPGRYFVLAYLPASAAPEEIGAAMAQLARHEALFDDLHCCFFGILGHPRLIESAQDSPPGIRWFLDPDGELFRDSGMSTNGHGDESGWIVLDPALRVMRTAPLSEGKPLLRWVSELPGVDDHAGTPIHAPVLIVPRVLEPGLCAELIAMHESGRREAGTVIALGDDGEVLERAVEPDYRAAVQTRIEDPDLKRRIDERLRRRLAPEVLKALRHEVGEIEGQIVVAYDAADQGRFRVHRDNLPPLDHRQFTFAINLNADDYEGGELRFPEYGTATYRPPTGAAIVFASSLLHEVTVVRRGRRYVLVAWIVDRRGRAGEGGEGEGGLAIEIHG
ncbi:MAG TPA: 2OG-Fe(II) oxygenase [Allosphingosinicella sp.]|jgi:hypothetical protein